MTAQRAASKARSPKHRADTRMTRLIHYLEGVLTSSQDKDERQAAAEQLTRILLAQAAYHNDAQERQLKRDLAAPKAPTPTPKTPAEVAALIEQLKLEATGGAR